MCYGNFPQKFKWNVFDMNCTQSSNKVYKDNIIHPCPKPFNVWFYLVEYLNPKSVLDPFLGSGTTAEVCTKLDIPWIGYEINEKYSNDINLRLKNCKPIQKLKQYELNEFGV